MAAPATTASSADWRPAPLVAHLASLPRPRRETLLAGAFAVVAGVWAPLGVLAFLTRSFTLYVGLSLVVLAILAAPRPTSAGAASSATAAAGRGVAAVRSWLRQAVQDAGPMLRRVRDEARPVLERMAAEARRAWLAVSAVVRRAVDGVTDRIGPHSTPRSTR